MIKKLLKQLFKQKDTTIETVEPKTFKSLEEFINSDLIPNYIESEKKDTTLLKPHFSDTSLSYDTSKMGGIPNLNNFEKYPVCDHCHNPLNFILQLYKDEFPEFHFEGEDNFFQLFRCPNQECSGINYEDSDLPMYHYYFSASKTSHNKEFEIPNTVGEDLETQPSDCEFIPERTIDLPNYDETENGIYGQAEEEYGEDAENLLFEEYSAKVGTKIGGYPAWTQSPNYPLCRCGKTKEFLFQFSSEEVEDKKKTITQDKWSPHGIMIGDVGNIYYFICKSCGKESIESNFDCS